MCDDHADTTSAEPEDALALTRRRLLRGTAALTGGLLLGGTRALLHPDAALAATTAAAPVTNAAGLSALRHAMHVHSSYSEGSASLQAQLQEASDNGFHTLWTTDHDWRMSAYRAPQSFHFPALTETVAGAPYTWQPRSDGAGLASRAAHSSWEASPLDPEQRKGCLTVAATSAGTAVATHGCELDGSRANQRHRTNLRGVRLLLEVLPELGAQGDAWGQVELALSYRPRTAGRPGGVYRLVYRLVPLALGHGRTVPATGTVGTVDVPVVDGQWNSLALDPVADVAALWPDLVAADNSLGGLFLGTSSRRRSPGTVRYSWLRFARSASAGDAPLAAQAELIAAYAGRFGGLTVEQGVEVSGTSEHSNWFGGRQHLIDYTAPVGRDLLAWSSARIHAYGGLASLNHPFGSGGGGLLGAAAQDARRRAVAADLLARGVGGVDVVEAGYRRRGGMSLESHLALVDTLWRAGFWVTATGVNDNHEGRAGQWAHELNHFYTCLWQASQAGADAVAALRRGSAFVGELGAFSGHLDLSVDGAAMGAALVRPGRAPWTVDVLATDLPSGSTVEVLQGAVDYLGAHDPSTWVVRRLPGSVFRTGSAHVTVPAAASSYVRVQVRAADGRLVAFGNPVFLLREEPPERRALPPARRPA